MDHQIITAYAGVVIGLGQLGMIGWGLWRMGTASKERNQQLDRQDKVMERQGEVLGQIGQALERQSQAMTQAFTQQGEVLAELLRRSA